MNLLNKILPRIECSFTVLSVIISLPLFIYVRSLYDAITAIILFILMSAFCLGVKMLIGKLPSKTPSIPILIMLCGALAILLSNVGKGLNSNIAALALCAFLSAVALTLRFESKDDIKHLSVDSGIRCGVLALFGLLREFLISGTILKGFTENGIHIIGHKLGEYINSASSIFLILTFAVFIAERLIEHKSFNIDGTFRAVVWASVLAAVLSAAIFGLNKTAIAVVTPALLYIVAAVLFVVFRHFSNEVTALFISMEMLIISSALIEYAETMISLLVASAVVSVCLCVACLLIELYAQKKKKHILSYASFIMMLFTYLIEFLF